MNSRLNRMFRTVIIVVLTLMIMTSGAAAQGSDPTDDEVNAIAKQLYCPVCENVPLDACGTAACEQWRGIIRAKLQEGWTDQQIKTYFVNQYGDRVLAEPPRQGFNWVVYIVPLVIFLGGIFLLFRGFQTWRSASEEGRGRGKQARAGVTKTPSDEYKQRVEDDLKNRKKL